MRTRGERPPRPVGASPGRGLPATSVTVSPALGVEVEPNGSTATATAINTPARIQANLFPNGDIDFYSFTATAGDRIYIATMTSWSAGSSTDSQITLLASDGTTEIEFDDDNGSFAGLSSSIAGATIPSNGTYFIQINDFTAGTTSERPYELYVRVQSGSPTPETEPNDTPGTANPLPASGWVSGARNPAAATEQDWFSLALNAGDTVYLGLDLDPEDDLVVWNGRLGFALFGDANNQILVVDDAGTGDISPDPNRPSEAMFFTVKDAGTYFAFVDSASAAVGGPTATYHLSVTVFPKINEGVNCTTYTSTDVPKTIGPGTGLVSSVITVPGNPRIQDIDVSIQLNHALMQDIDAHLRSPNNPEGNNNGLFTDIGAAATGGQTMMDLILDDEAAIPPSFTVMRPLSYKPELNYRLNWFDGENAGGTWTLDLYDDTAGANGGTLTGWSLRICEQPAVSGSLVYSENFDGMGGTDGGFTHSGTADEWERGLPATMATTTANPVAAFTTCNSGVNCWKTDLDNTYNVSSNQDLMSPSINLAGRIGPVTLEWAMRYQMESATFDHARVIVQQAGMPATARTVWEFLDATMTDAPGNPAVNIGASAGWGRYRADISSFAGQNIEVIFHVDSDNTVNFGGMAIDDVAVYATAVTPTTPGQVIISEFRYNGPNGALDEYVELYNNTDAQITVVDSGAGTGWAIVTGDNTSTPKAVIPTGTTIPARGHLLLTNSGGYSLGQYPSGNNGVMATTATGDITYTTDIPINRGIALFRTTVAAAFTGTAERLDAVGPASETQPAANPYREGTGLPDIAAIASDYAWARRLPGGCTGTQPGFVNHNCTSAALIQSTPAPTSGNVQDSGNNVTDFIFVDINGTATPVGNQRLGAPGPENRTSPIVRGNPNGSGTINPSVIDPQQASSASPNRVRDLTPVTNGTFGTIDIRRKFTNNTGGPVTRLRFRVMDISTFPPLDDVGTTNDAADLRALTSTTTTVTITGGSMITVQGTTLEQDTSGNPGQPVGGAFNSSLSAGTVTLGTPLANGASISVRFVFGVTQNGKFRVFVIVEALP